MVHHTLSQDLWLSAGIAVLGLHLLFNLWYVFGALVTKGRPGLEILHILSLFYGVIAENASFQCPLTVLEKWCQSHAGVQPYNGNFELHYFRAIVAPHFPLWLLEYGAGAVFVINIAIYARRFALRHAHSHRHAH
ncbi:MAG TPA: DUF2784 family protein [Candidatus Acidoferrales bacterium]|nr:DUF2784 family protein [Candidatus Acidoferrales bacterium]